MSITPIYVTRYRQYHTSTTTPHMDDVLRSEVRAVLKLSLDSQSNLISALNEDRRQAPVVRELIEAILFSRRILPTYLVVLFVAVLSWSLAQWTVKYAAKSARKSQAWDHRSAPSVASSSSSTLQGTESPPLKSDAASESSPLLTEAQSRTSSPRPLYTRRWHDIRSLLLRQPKPIPSLTAPKNTLPANEISLLILTFLALNLFYLFYRMPMSMKHAFTFADRAGILFVVNLPVLYILAAKNNQPLGWLTGWSYEGLNIFHRRLGEWMTVAAILHAIGMVIGFYQLLAPFGYSFGWYLTRKIIMLGVIGFFCYIAIYLTSTGYVRQAYYEAFLALHISLQVAALALIFFHHHNARPYVGAALAIWTMDRVVSRTLFKTQQHIATLELAQDGETVLLYCDIQIKRRWSMGIRGGWHAGQHVFLSVPGLGPLHRLQAHPFTIASPAPPRGKAATRWTLQLTIRAQDGFSRELLEYAKLHQHTKIHLDGPYSSDIVTESVETADRACLVAGGSGIAVTYPFAWLREASNCRAADILQDRIFYIQGRKSLPDIVRLKGLLDEMRFAHFWVRQDTGHEHWVKMLPNAEKSIEQQHEESEPLYPNNNGTSTDLITHRFDTRGPSGEHQRPDIATELKIWVKGDLKLKIDANRSVCVVVSGPDGLVRDVQNAVAELVMDGWNIQIHVEKFGW